MSPKSIKKLVDKKHRNETGLFIVEGDKNIRELLNSDFVVTEIVGTVHFFNAIHNELSAYTQKLHVYPRTSNMRSDELARAGSLMTNEYGIAIVKQKEELSFEVLLEHAKNDFVLVLDDVRDPGNLGTIVRIADWYGITHIAASRTTTDFYNPKTISATMGSFTRSLVSYGDHIALLQKAQEMKIPVLSADMHGKNIHDGDLPKNGFVVMGSESHGVSEEALAYTSDRVTIPRFGNAESLNVSVATGIILDALRRK